MTFRSATNTRQYVNTLAYHITKPSGSGIGLLGDGRKYIRDFIAADERRANWADWRIDLFSSPEEYDAAPHLPESLRIQRPAGRPPRGKLGRTHLANLEAALAQTQQPVLPFSQLLHPHDIRETWTLPADWQPPDLRTTHFAWLLLLCMRADRNINPKPVLIRQLWAGWLQHHPELQHRSVPTAISDALDVPLLDYMQPIEFRGVWKHRKPPTSM